MEEGVTGAECRLLIVDDERDILELLGEYLTPQYEVVAVLCPEEALRICQEQRFHLALVDIRLPGMSAWDLIPRLQALDPQMGIVLMTAYARLSDAVHALRDMEVLDYIPKPFLPEEVRQGVARALAKRGQCRRIKLGDLVIDPAGRQVERAGKVLPLTRQEFDLVLYLARHKGRVVPYDELYAAVWQCQPDAWYEEVIRNAMSRLRDRLGDDPACPRYFRTVRGVGYQAMG